MNGNAAAVHRPHLNTDQLPPHSLEAEQGVLGCLLIAPGTCLDRCRSALPRGPEEFYDIRHQTIYHAILTLADEAMAIDIITLVDRVKHRIEDAGGIEYLAALPDAVPSALNLDYYLPIVHRKFVRRLAIQRAQDIIAKAMDEVGDDAWFDDVVWSIQSEMAAITRPETASSTTQFSPRELINFDTARDENTVIGLTEDGQTTRYLCRGYGAWMIGQSHIGKSSLMMQFAVSWALGQPIFGIRPKSALRILIVQAENDVGDNAEMMKGVCDGFGLTEWDAEFERIDRNLKVITEGNTTRAAFCRMLGRQIERHNADLVFVDPLLSFAGIEVSRQDQCTQFLREWLNPILAGTGCVMIGAHHTGKPKDPKTTKGWSILDYAYAGIGSSELVNWARAVSVLLQTADRDRYVLKLAKRGPRAGASHPNEEKAPRELYLRHGEAGIQWIQCDPPEEEPAEAHSASQEPGGGRGRPSKTEQVIGLGLGPVIDQISEPISQRELARRIELFAAENHFDASFDTCRRAVEKLVENKAIKKTQNGYEKP